LTSSGTAGINHPFHLHGYSFYVLAMGKFEKGQTEEDLIEELISGDLKISKNPPSRDTVAIPASGYTVIRILARNPGKVKELIAGATALSISSSHKEMARFRSLMSC
jgi:FtsP/CotA-like multicopper oxidase with cupredoxin domain